MVADPISTYYFSNTTNFAGVADPLTGSLGIGVAGQITNVANATSMPSFAQPSSQVSLLGNYVSVLGYNHSMDNLVQAMSVVQSLSSKIKLAGGGI